MLQQATRALALRVGWCAGDPSSSQQAGGDPSSRPPRGACLAELPFEGADNPWGLDACLVLAEPLPGEPAPASELIDRVAAALRADLPGVGDTATLLPEALLAAHARAREPRVGMRARFRLSLVCVRGGRCWAAQSPALPAYLLRDGALRPLQPEVRYHSPRGEEADLEPEIAAGRLQDGDALVLCSHSLHGAVSDHDVCDVLIHASNPEAAARRLVREAQRRGAVEPAAAILFAGLGPAVAHRLRHPGPLTHPGRPEGSGAGRKASSVALIAAVTGLAGALLGVGIGLALSVGGKQPAPPDTPPPATLGSSSPILPSGPPQQVGGMTPTPPQPAATSAPPSPVTGNPPPAPNAPAPGLSAAPAASAASVGPAAEPIRTPGAVPVALDTPPPGHTLAPGMGGGIQLTLRTDPSAGTLGLQLNQGVLFSRGTPQGVPVGETLAVPLTDFQTAKPAGEPELRLLSGGRTAATLAPDSIKRLQAGESVSVPGLRPGVYDLSWWSPQAGTSSAPFLSLRIEGL